MSTLAGNVCIRNGFELDFCWTQCIESLLPVCDMVSVSDGESTDGTQEFIREWMRRETKIVLNVWPWPDPKGNPNWFADWINYNREHCRADWQFQLDADEILSERSYDEVRRFIEQPNRAGIVTRYNFWRDHRHLIPEGQCLGKYVIRLAPQRIWLASDGYDERGTIAPQMSQRTNIEIFHYGFIRKRDQFFKKERLLQNYYFNSYDPRLEAVEGVEGNWMDDPRVSDYSRNPDSYDGYHPSSIHGWLRDRGMHV
jgi:glycosyltransferase involved in cell wall biosynthesis